MSIIERMRSDWRLGSSLIINNPEDEGHNAIDMALDRGLLFTPRKVEVATSDGAVPRDKDGKPWFYRVERDMPDGSIALLNPAVSDGFSASGYNILYEQIDMMFPGSTIDMALFGDGRRTMVRVRPDEPVTVHGDDRLSMEILFVASLDNAWSTAAYGTAWRFACSNQLTLDNLVFRVKRTRNHDDLLFDRVMIMMQATDRFHAFVEHARRLSMLQVDRWDYMRIMDKLMPRPEGKDGAEPHRKTLALWERRRKGVDKYWAIERDRCGSNRWALVQAIQSYEFHDKTKDDAEKQIEHVRDPHKHEPLSQRMLAHAL
jgi:hypothetical protein